MAKIIKFVHSRACRDRGLEIKNAEGKRLKMGLIDDTLRGYLVTLFD